MYQPVVRVEHELDIIDEAKQEAARLDMQVSTLLCHDRDAWFVANDLSEALPCYVGR